MKTIDFYLIRAISNLHVGSGEGDFSVIDKQVQRDPITNLPTIHASGIKGALRESMEYSARHKKDDEKSEAKKNVVKVFGSDPKRKNGTIQQGLNNFFTANLLALPIRSSHEFFFMATCPMVLEKYIADLKIFAPGHELIAALESLKGKASSTGAKYFFKKEISNLRLEDWTPEYGGDLSTLKVLEDEKNFGERIALLTNDQFHTLAKELPIIARNYLNDGISQNLWYEEVVPREARFYAMVSRHQDNDYLNDFLKEKDHLVQIGANATVGYGLCNFKPL